MASQHLKQMNKMIARRPGAQVSIVRKWSFWVLLTFFFLSTLGVGLLLSGIWIPGRAFLAG